MGRPSKDLHVVIGVLLLQQLHDLSDAETVEALAFKSYVRKLVTELSGGVFGYLDSVLERHSFDEFGELI